ncbi:hypothetical protein GLOIN_2v1761433 [Rhizophagus clarus]|uniref:Uncharacterized protein n=1 Tax=Rhizophagus clarus TaxID=94130 RepID=A0A8H3LGK9_9GLOM|nr:hypothetical protein GLOIN_2v1761433 [Rhizophagus clarus]
MENKLPAWIVILKVRVSDCRNVSSKFETNNGTVQMALKCLFILTRKKFSSDEFLSFYRVSLVNGSKNYFHNLCITWITRRLYAIVILQILMKLLKDGQKLTIEKHMHSYVTRLQRLKFLFKNTGTVDKKNYIIATVNLPRGTPVYNLPAEYKDYSVLIDYGTMRASTNPNKCHEIP